MKLLTWDRPTKWRLVALLWACVESGLDVLSNYHDSRTLPLVDWWTAAFDNKHDALRRDHELRLARIEGVQS